MIIVPVPVLPGMESVSVYLRPDVTTGLIASYTQGSIAGELGADADTWPSALVGGLALAAASGAQKPSVNIDGYAQKVLTFAGTDRMTLGGFALPVAFTVAVKADWGAGGTDGWPISLESGSKRIAIFDTANTLSGYVHVSAGASNATSALSSADPVGLSWLVLRGVWGGQMQIWRGSTAGPVVTAPAFGTTETFVLHVGARSTNASPKGGAYQQVRVFDRFLEDRDILALVAS